jgi:hypothetical protein
MGNESSVPVEDDVRPATLKERTLEAVADYIKEKNVTRIVVMVHALNSPIVISQLIANKDWRRY